MFEVKLRLTNPFGRPIIAESVSATVMPKNGKKKEVIDFSLDQVWKAQGAFPTKKKGDYSVTYSIKLEGGVELTTTESYASTTSVSVSLKKFEGGKATFGLEFSDLNRNKADRVYLRAVHKTDKSEVHTFYDGSTKAEDYHFDKVALGGAAASGEYNVYAVVVDATMASAHEQWIGTIKHEAGDVAAAASPYSKQPIIEWTFRPEENECNDPVTPLAFAIASGAPLLVLLILGSAMGWNLKQFGGPGLCVLIAIGVFVAFSMFRGFHMLWKGPVALLVVVFLM